jgi:lipopolysaccharide/colanic/teichoic acid biosynthesis glycosyltransferase
MFGCPDTCQQLTNDQAKWVGVAVNRAQPDGSYAYYRQLRTEKPMSQQVTHNPALYQQAAHGRVTYSQIGLGLLQKFDPLALSPLVRDRAAYHFFKRVLDVSVAILILVLLTPLMAVIAVLIFLDSGWPPIFVQPRVGARRWVRNGYSYWQQTTFTFYKFRSMHKNADPQLHRAFVQAFIQDDHESMVAIQQRAREDGNHKPHPALTKTFVHPSGKAQGEVHQINKLVDDPRVTRIGRLLRTSSLDELPQFWNVVKGDMSLVGPRPDVPYSVELYKPRHYRRLAAQPGISGLWQVKGRCQSSFEEMVRLDIEYADKQSIWLDLKILLSTIPAVLARRGAV